MGKKWFKQTNSMKTFSTIALITFCILLTLLVAFIDIDVDAAIGAGVLSNLLAIGYTVAILSGGNVAHKSKINASEIMDLNNLKDKGIINETEFEIKKHDLLR